MSRSCTLANMEQDAPLRPEEEIRREKRDRLRSLGMDPYSVDVNRNTMIGDAIIHFQKLSEEAKQVIFAGRVMSVRVHGGMMSVMSPLTRSLIATLQELRCLRVHPPPWKDLWAS